MPLVDQSPRLPVEIAHELYGRQATATRLISNNNHVYRLDFCEGPSKIIKLAVDPKKWARILREQEALRTLNALCLPVPQLEHTEADLEGSPCPFITMAVIPGTTLEEACRDRNVPWAEAGCRWAGRFVTVMEGISPDMVPGAESLGSSLKYLREVCVRLDAEGIHVAPFSDILQQTERLMVADAGCVVHGDYSWGQIITDGRTFSAIDWESVRIGHPLDMLGRAVAMAREYGGRPEHIEWMVAGYEGEAPLTNERRRQLHIWEMWHHLNCAGWKLVCGPDHRRHAFAIADEVRAWYRP